MRSLICGLILCAACGRTAPAPADAAVPVARPVPVLCPTEVVVAWPGASTMEVEATVLVPLERATAGLGAVEGEARPGRARLRLEGSVDPGRLRVALDAVELPPDADRPVIRLGGEPRLRSLVVLSGAEADAHTLRRQADALAQRLLALDARVWAPAASEVEIWLDSKRLAAYGLDLEAVGRAVRADRAKVPQGFIRPGAPPTDLAVLAEIVVAAPGGQPVRLRDLARISRSTPPLPRAWHGGVPAAVVEVRGEPPADLEGAVVLGPFGGCGSVPEGWVRTWLPPGEASRALAAPFPTLVLADAEGVEIWSKSGDPTATPALAAQLRQAVPGGEVVAGGEATRALVLSHPDLAVLAPAAAEGAAALARLPGVLGVRVEGPASTPELAVQLAPEARPHAAAIAQLIRAATEGIDVGDLEVDGERLATRIRLGEAVPAGPDRARVLGELTVATPAGLVPLARLATFTLEAVPTRILRINGRRVARLHVAGSPASDALSEAIRRLGTPHLDIEVR